MQRNRMKLNVTYKLNYRDESALRVVEEFLRSDGAYAALRVKFAESWINEKNRRKNGTE